MSASSSPLFPALSFVAVILAGSALYFAQQQPESTPVQTQASFDPSVLEESITALRQEMMGLQTKLDSLDKPTTEKPAPLTEEEQEEKRIQLRAIETERINAAVEAVMEKRGIELAQEAQRQAKREETRTRMPRWVGNAREKLPNLYEKIAEKMDLDPQTEMAVEEILESSFFVMTELTAELEEGDLTDEEALAVQTEIRQEAGSIVGQLDEVLDPEEMVQLGQLYSAEVDPRLGQGMINNGNQGNSDDEG